MYVSIKGWLNVPCTIKPFSTRVGTGDKTFGASHNELCYPVYKEAIVRNADGIEVASSTQLHFDGSVTVTALDNVLFDNTEYPIQAVHNYYRNGAVDIKVVYL